MRNDIEQADRKRVKELGVHAVIYSVFVVFSLVWFFLRALGPGYQPGSIPVGVCLGLVGGCALVYSWFRRLRISRTIRKDPKLREALDNEMLAMLELRAWKPAFLAVAAAILFFSIASAILGANEPVLIAITSVVIGFGAQRVAFFLGYRAL
jgi:Na+/melibiose symporter-like transporter